jgi:hypothetical protein
MTKQLQIRTSSETVLEDLLEEMTCKGWAFIEDQFRSTWYSPGTFSGFYGAIRKAFEPYVKTYDLCGCFPECSDEVEGSPWLDHDDHVYQLTLSTTFERFVEDVAFHALESVKPLLQADKVSQAFESLKLAFRSVLIPHIYSNPACKKIAICSLAKEVDVFSHESRLPEAAKA